MIKTCSKCGQAKPCTEFWKKKDGKDGLMARCKDCHRVICAARYQRTKDHRQQQARARRAANPEKYKEMDRWAQIRHKYGIGKEAFTKLLEDQHGCCAICGRAFDDHIPRVDHNHATGEIRGLLCNNCNGGLGLFFDDPVNLRAAIGYLQEKGSYGRQTSPTASV